MSYELICVDCDGTLIETKGGTAFRKDPDDWHFPGNTLQHMRGLLRSEGKPDVCVITNQSGPVWRHVTGKDKFLSAQSLGYTLRTVDSFISGGGIYLKWYISIYDQRIVDLIEQQNNREIYADATAVGSPADTGGLELVNPKQVFQAVQREMFSHLEHMNLEIGYAPNWRKPAPGMIKRAMADFHVTDASRVLMVGDREDDQGAAQAAGVHFQWAHAYFEKGEKDAQH